MNRLPLVRRHEQNTNIYNRLRCANPGQPRKHEAIYDSVRILRLIPPVFDAARNHIRDGDP
jgi:hypothetical protein